MKAKLIVEGKEFDIEINDPELQKLVTPPKNTGYERVEDGHTYSFVNTYGEIRTLDHEGPDDDLCYESANYYSDRTVAENNARADKLMRQLRRYAVFHRDNDVDWYNINQTKYFIYYDYNGDALTIGTIATSRRIFGIYFSSRSDAQAVIDIYHDELIWYCTEYKDSL